MNGIEFTADGISGTFVGNVGDTVSEYCSTPILSIYNKVLGFDDPHYMRQMNIKFRRNPDIFSYDTSKDYKEDYDLVEGSFCDCGCKSAVYRKDEGYGDDSYTEIITQTEYEELPNEPQPTPEQVKLEGDIIRADREETELGIIHDKTSCSEIPIPKLVFRIPEDSK